MARVLLFANGKITNPQSIVELLRPGDLIYCANGGADNAMALGLIPDVIIGDMDSLSEQSVQYLQNAGVQLVRYPVKKDQTDLELALLEIKKRNLREIIILTALGGRIDQQLANILLLARPEFNGLDLTLIDDRQKIRVFRGPAQITVMGNLGDTLSIIPISERIVGLTLEGFEFPAQRITVLRSGTLTMSNIFVQSNGLIRIEEGLAIIVHIKGK